MSISKKIRFEVFKRDGFRCAYCGKSPPDVLLEIDHIQPKSKRGKDDVNNYLTACFDCNRGKRATPLNVAPLQLAENLAILKEKELQLREYNRLIAKIERRIKKDAEIVNNIYSSTFPDWQLTERFKTQSIALFLKRLPSSEVLEAMKLTCDRVGDKDVAVKYFCGVCWRKIKGK